MLLNLKVKYRRSVRFVYATTPFLIVFGYISNTLLGLSDPEFEINLPLLFTGFSVFIILIRALYLCIKILEPRTTMTTGIMPEKLIRSAPIDKHGKSELQLIDILLLACENFQVRIDKNINSNEKRTDIQHKIYTLISLWIPVVAIIIFTVAVLLT